MPVNYQPSDASGTELQMSQRKSLTTLWLVVSIALYFNCVQTVRASVDSKQAKVNQLNTHEMTAIVTKCNTDGSQTSHETPPPLKDLDGAATSRFVPTPKRSGSVSARISETASPRNKCTRAERELDRCSAQLIGLGQTGELVYPDNMQDLDTVYCPKFRSTVACIRNTTDCFKPFERQVINWILSSTKKMNYKRCKNENEKIRFLRLTNSCFASMKNPMDDCMGRYIAQLDAIAEYNRDLERLTENDIQIQLSCCANKRFKQCVMQSARQGCQSHESLKKLRRTNSLSSQRVARKHMQRVVQDTMDDLKTTLNEMALTGPEFICTGVDEKFCKSKFDGRYSNRIARHKSIVPAMVKIYANK